jgi:hypothetical protein
METFVGGLILAAVSGLAWFAYNHPAQFKPFSIGLMIVWAIGCVICIA